MRCLRKFCSFCTQCVRAKFFVYFFTTISNLTDMEYLFLQFVKPYDIISHKSLVENSFMVYSFEVNCTVTNESCIIIIIMLPLLNCHRWRIYWLRESIEEGVSSLICSFNVVVVVVFFFIQIIYESNEKNDVFWNRPTLKPYIFFTLCLFNSIEFAVTMEKYIHANEIKADVRITSVFELYTIFILSLSLSLLILFYIYSI